MIIWLNGSFGSGKTTLAAELHRRLERSVVFDPEELGITLWKWLPRNEDFQDLPSWRELVVATALSLLRHHTETLIVPMTLLNDRYREEIFGGLAAAGESPAKIFLDADSDVLKQRIMRRGGMQDGEVLDHGAQAMLEWALQRVDAAAARRQSADTIVLRSDTLSTNQLADVIVDRVVNNR